ncbi:unnamed protein product [Parascedosporium putredinis]|uniref:Ribosomal protein S21 n=1 Tax=Parascedosporium putredinis TaxID=1442378 RepID=A0A9P1H2W2_9PEZI|nr:unnamed protein product [Parascedosporium putredinis]CAI7995198.1 unnamed protein product [Parascedosporium putredinis]
MQHRLKLAEKLTIFLMREQHLTRRQGTIQNGVVDWCPIAAPQSSPKPKSKSKDSAEGGKASTRASAPYDATKFSIAQLIGNDMTSALASSDYHAKPIRVPIRAVPSTGRTVHVSGPINPARAFAMLNQRCTQNRLATIANQQRFHERPGLKRKRLHRTRWRARFKKGFHATVVRVQELVRQGW